MTTTTTKRAGNTFTTTATTTITYTHCLPNLTAEVDYQVNGAWLVDCRCGDTVFVAV